MQSAGLMLLALVVMPTVALAGDTRCMYDGNFYESGAGRCNDAGKQERCADGVWKPLGLDCADEGAGAAGMAEEPAVDDDRVDTPGRPAVPPGNDASRTTTTPGGRSSASSPPA